ncbi:MAG: ribosomal-processing cysteine protease Prp [Christensenellales bacterium]|jgi:uncharacterized protein YsxB (DUF464 family)
MTRIHLWKKDGLYLGLQANGHTGFAEEGRDIVCAAVSVLCQTMIVGLDEVAGVSPDYRIEDGELFCRVGEDNAKRRDVQAILRTIVKGLQAVYEQYPDFMELLEMEV